MTPNNDTVNLFDPTGLFKSMRESSTDAWAKMMIQLVNTEAYSQAIGTSLDAWLTASAPFRKALEQGMASALSSANLPSRADFISLAERLTNLEMRLDDMDAKLDELLRGSRKGAGAKSRNNAGEDKS
jgi:hypothetical protein